MGRKSKRKSKPNQPVRTPSKANSLKNHAGIDESELIVNKPILINDRLYLAPYHSEDLEDDDSELQLDFRPRPYYVSSLCYVCSKLIEERGVARYTCNDCQMVSYCSSQHRQENAKQHKQLCQVLGDICRKNDGLSFAKDLNADEYRVFRVELLRMVEVTLGRSMELWEREILLYPKLCRLCHDSRDLTRCDDCSMEFYCSGQEHRGNHNDHCEEFKVFRCILSAQYENGFAAPRIPNVAFDEGHAFPNDFDRLIKEVFEYGCDYEKIDCASYAALSQAASPALTAFHTLRNTPQFNKNLNRKAFKIHVIGAELQFECANLAVWEKLFLHLLPAIKCLKLSFCGPELHVPPDIANILQRPKLCRSCRAKNRTIDITFHCGMLYHQVESDKPDLICLFNPGLYRTTGFANQDTWPKTIEKFCDYGVPILVTSYTEIELPRDLARMREHRDVIIEQEPQRNPFASLKPERNFVSDDVAPLIYKNYFLSVARGNPRDSDFISRLN